MTSKKTIPSAADQNPSKAKDEVLAADVQNTVKQEAENVANTAKQYSEKVGDKLKSTVEGINQRLGGVSAVGKETFSVVKESGNAAATGVADIGKETGSYFKGYWEDLSGTAKAVFEAKNLEQVAEIEINYVTGRIEDVTGHVKTIADISARASLAAFMPWAESLSKLAVRADNARYARDQ